MPKFASQRVGRKEKYRHVISAFIKKKKTTLLNSPPSCSERQMWVYDHPAPLSPLGYPEKIMQPRSSMATVLPASSPGPRGPCCWVIPSARCVTSGSTRNGRRVGFSTTPPRQKPAGDISPAAGASRHHHQPWARCAPGRSPARDPWRSGGGDGREGGPDPRAHRPGLRQPSGAEPSERAEPHEVEPGSAIFFLGARARAAPAAAPAPRTYRWSPISP